MCEHFCCVCLWESFVKGISLGTAAPWPVLRTRPSTFPHEISSAQGGRHVWISPLWAWLVGKTLRRSQETQSTLGGGTSEMDPLGLSVPLPEPPCVTLEWEGALIFDPHEAVQFCYSRLYHPDLSQAHIHLVPRAPGGGSCAELCGSLGQLGPQSPAAVSPAHSHESCPSEQSSATLLGLSPTVDIARYSRW